MESNNQEFQIQRCKQDLNFLEESIKELFHFLPLPICIVNPLNIIIGVNKSFEETIGFQDHEISGKTISELFLEKDKINNLVKAILQNDERIVEELHILVKDQKVISVNIYVMSRKDEAGNFIGYFVAFSDISKLKDFQKDLEIKVKEKTKDLRQSKKALLNILEDIDEARGKIEQEKNKLLSIITNFTDGLLIFDKNNKVSLINAQAEELLEIKSKELIGKDFKDLKKIDPFNSLFKIIGPKIQDLHRKEAKIKEKSILEVTIIPIMEGESKVASLLILHDITREKMVEKMKTEFVSLSAHQLRTPLAAIKWTLKMLLDEDLGKITKQQRGFIEKTYTSNERMISLINELLNITKIEEGRYIVKTSSNDIVAIINSVIDIYKEESKKKNINIDFQKPKEKIPKIKIDVEKIQLCIQNLIDNAIRYSDPGGNIRISVKLIGNKIELMVQDNGLGIPRNQQERIFSKFFRASNVVKKDVDGSGLGLFIVKNIIEAHRGKIWFESEENKGTTFYFTLPV